MRLANGGLVNWGRFGQMWIRLALRTFRQNRLYLWVGVLDLWINALIQFASLILLKWMLTDWGVFRPLIAGVET